VPNQPNAERIDALRPHHSADSLGQRNTLNCCSHTWDFEQRRAFQFGCDVLPLRPSHRSHPGGALGRSGTLIYALPQGVALTD